MIAEVTGEIDISTVARLRERLFELAGGSQPLITDLLWMTGVDRRIPLAASLDEAMAAAAQPG